MFEGPVTGNTPEVLHNGEVTDGTHVTAGQLALALTPYAQVTDLAVASGNNAAAIQSLDDRVTAELASKLDSSALAPAIARTGGRARKQHRRAAELAVAVWDCWFTNQKRLYDAQSRPMKCPGCTSQTSSGCKKRKSDERRSRSASAGAQHATRTNAAWLKDRIDALQRLLKVQTDGIQCSKSRPTPPRSP